MHLLLARLGMPGAEGCRVFKVLYPSVVPGLGAAEAVPAFVPSVFFLVLGSVGAAGCGSAGLCSFPWVR